MSPVGGIGINFAIQDAVEAANQLAGPLRERRLRESELAAVQRRRAWQVRIMQLLQARVLIGALSLASGSDSPRLALLRALLGVAQRVPWVRNLPPRIIALGIRRVRVRESQSRTGGVSREPHL
jgi:2-polyprenyl-6-methoxyphenol hydroxylase-like FAD-dependent oxidoreductase